MNFRSPSMLLKKLPKLVLFILVLLVSRDSCGQNADAETLRKDLAAAKTPLERFNNLKLLFNYYLNIGSSDSMAVYSNQMLEIGRQQKNDSLLTICYGSLGVYFKNQSDFIHALDYGFKSLEMAKASKGDLKTISVVYGNIGSTYLDMGNYVTALKYVQMALDIQLKLEKEPGVLYRICSNYCNLALAYINTNNPRKGLHYTQLANQINTGLNIPHLRAGILGLFAQTFDQLNSHAIAETYYQKAIAYCDSVQNLTYLIDASKNYSKFLIKGNDYPGAKKYALKSLQAAKLSGNTSMLIDIAATLQKIFNQQKKTDSAYYFAKMELAYRDTIFNEQKLNQIQDITFAQQIRENEEKATLAQEARERKQNMIYSAIAICLAGFIILFLLFSRINLAKVVRLRTTEVVQQKEEIEKTLENLKLTQEQLIRQEKFASIGQLTKGIMDRIQNPLNYIINFSLICKDLNEETIELLEKDVSSAEILREIISNDTVVQSNIVKIIEHGKSASRIVKGMEKLIMEKSTVFQETEISSLIEKNVDAAMKEAKNEHGQLNAKIITTEFENYNGKVKVLPAEMGTVITNLLSNSLYSVSEKMKQNPGYTPEIKVRTRFTKDKYEIRIRDNGKGIPAKEVSHIFSPFYTTKPTAKGTGLGLYLAMDIIKTHKGEIEVETQEGDFSEFILSLPIN